MDMILKIALPIIMSIIEKLLTPKNIITYGDKLFDFIESAVESSSNDIDNVTVLPIINALRISLNIPDNDNVVK